MRASRLPLLAFAALLAVAGCNRSRPTAGAPAPVTVPAGDPTGGTGGGTVTVRVAQCTWCHGESGRLSGSTTNALIAAAPPRAVNGSLSGRPVGAHDRHLRDGLAKALACATCHLMPAAATVEAHPAQAQQGRVTFALALPAPDTAWIARGTGGSSTWSGTTCASTYCHGNFPGGNNATVTWESGAAGCGSCHGITGQSPVPTSGGHPILTAGTLCATCHPGYGGAQDGAIGTFTVNPDLHVNGRLEGAGGHPAGWAAPGQHGLAAISFAAPNGGLAACTACHVDFGSAGASSAGDCTACHAAAGHATWQTECTFCHGGRDSTTTGAPPRTTAVISSDTATPEPTTLAAIGAHTSHTGMGAGPTQSRHALSLELSCSACHGSVPTDLTHVNGAVTSAFANVGATPNPGSYTAGAGCSATYCHGNFAGGAGSAPIAWTGTFGASSTLTCTSCHGNPPPLSAASHHPQNSACAACHGTGYSSSAVAGAALATHVDGSPTTTRTGCTSCHGDPTANAVADTSPTSAPGYNGSAVDSHGNTAATERGVGAHAAHLTGTSFRGTPIACSECHVVPTTGDIAHASSATATVTFGAGASTAWAGEPAISPAIAVAGSTVSCSSTYCHGNFAGGANATPTWNSPSAVACGYCHGIPPATVRGGSAHTANTACGSCHGGAYTSSSVDPTLHINYQLDGGGESGGGSNCGGCHGTIFSGMTNAAKVSKHFLGGGDVPTDGAGPWTGNLKSAAPYASASCVTMCHGDHPHDLTSPVTATHENNVYADASTQASRAASSASRVGSGGTGIQNRSRTDFDNALTAGGLCLSCHQNPIDAGHPALSKASYSSSAHNFTATTTPAATWQFQLHSGSFDRNCTKCHASQAEGRTPGATVNGSTAVSVHFSDSASLLAGSFRTAGTGTPAPSPGNFVCYNCHGNGTVGLNLAGAAGTDVYTQAAKAQGHGGATNATPENLHTDAVHDSALEAAATYNGGRFSGANRHVSCLDCHDPHEAGNTLHAQGSNAIAATSPLRGATGVTFTSPAASWAATASSNFSAAPVTATLEYQICLKCHSSFAFGTTLPTATPSGLAETDVAQEFSTSNQSYHPVVGALPASDPGANGSSRLAAAQLVGTDHTWTPGSLMTCSDCHNSDANAPAAQGPHGSAVTFMLAGTNKAWPFTTAGTTGTARLISGSETSINTNNGLFCRNCHPQVNSGASTNSLHTAVGSSSRHASGTNNFFACVSCHIRIPHGGKVSRLIKTPAAPVRYQTTGVGTPMAGFFKNSAFRSYTIANAFRDNGCSEHGATSGGEAW